GLDLYQLSAMAGRQLPFFSLIVPFWVVWAFAGFRGMLGVWPAALTAGIAFAVPQFLVSNFHGPWLVDIVAAITSMAAVSVLLKFWRPKDNWKHGEIGEAVERGARTALSAQEGREGRAGAAARAPSASIAHSELVRAWLPWVLLSLLVFLWGAPQVKDFLNGDY